MTYTKPEINALGDAVSVILSGAKSVGDIDPNDFNRPTLEPSYDLDE